MKILTFKIRHSRNNTGFLEDVIRELEKHGIKAKSVLYRASEHEELERIFKYGTDRGGFSEKKVWGYSAELSKEVLHEDVIFATTEEEIKYGEKNKNFQTSLKKFSLIEHPLLLVYDVNYFVKVAEKQYAFKNPEDKLSSLLAIFIVNKENNKP